MAEDKPTVEQAINESLIRDRDQAQKERNDLRALLSRPLNVSVGGPNDQVLQQIGQYLPQLTNMSTNISMVASAVQALVGNSGSLNTRLTDQNRLLERLAETLERMAPPVPAEPEERQADERFIHLGYNKPWNGRLCKKYGQAWTIFDPGPRDPCSAGDVCSADHSHDEEG